MTTEEIFDYMKGMFNKPNERRIVIYTGEGGYELFQETLEKEAGFERIYIGRKVPRILRILKGAIKKSTIGRYYKLIRKNESNN